MFLLVLLLYEDTESPYFREIRDKRALKILGNSGFMIVDFEIE